MLKSRLFACWLVVAWCRAHQPPNISALWETVQQTCDHGLCQRHSNTSSSVLNTTDCKARLLMYEYGLKLIPRLSPQREVFDALELQSCGITPPAPGRDHPLQIHLSPELLVKHRPSTWTTRQA